MQRALQQIQARHLHAAAPARRIFDDFRNMLQDAARPAVEVKALTEGEGFRFVDGLVIPSACILLGGSVFLWDVPAAPTDLRWQEWKTDHFKLFELLTVKPEILLVGTGKRVVPVASHLKKYLNSLGIQVDAYDSWNACSTYNMLAEEGRRVAAAVIPLRDFDAKTGQTLS